MNDLIKVLMVEDFTTIKEEAYCDIASTTVQIDEEFEEKVRHHVQLLAKEPRQRIVDDILNYSRSISKM